jgi:hypothetical protein
MPSQNSSKAPNKPARFSAPELVSTAFIDQVLTDWQAYIAEQMEQDLQSLVAASDWQYQEALSYLCGMVLQSLGVEKPLIESFALLGSNPVSPGFVCELVLVWSTAMLLDPGDVLEGCTVTRVDNFPLPSKGTFINKEKVRRAIVAQWAYILSTIADDLPKKEM